MQLSPWLQHAAPLVPPRSSFGDPKRDSCWRFWLPIWRLGICGSGRMARLHHWRGDSYGGNSGCDASVAASHLRHGCPGTGGWPSQSHSWGAFWARPARRLAETSGSQTAQVGHFDVKGKGTALQNSRSPFWVCGSMLAHATDHDGDAQLTKACHPSISGWALATQWGGSQGGHVTLVAKEIRSHSKPSSGCPRCCGSRAWRWHGRSFVAGWRFPDLHRLPGRTCRDTSKWSSQAGGARWQFRQDDLAVGQLLLCPLWHSDSAFGSFSRASSWESDQISATFTFGETYGH